MTRRRRAPSSHTNGGELLKRKTPAPIVWNWPAKPSIERLSEIKQPTLIIVGDMDVPGTLAISDALKEKIGGARKIVIRGVSHHLNMEKPKEFNKAVLDFLKEK